MYEKVHKSQYGTKECGRTVKGAGTQQWWVNALIY